LQTAFEGQDQATRDAALATIFGSDAIRAANVLYTQGAKGIKDWTNKVNDSGFAAETAATKLDNLKGDLEAFKGSLETALIGTGEGAQGPLRSLVQTLTDVVNAYGKLPGAAQGVVAGMLGITAITGGGLWFGTKVVSGVVETKKALSDLSLTAPRAATGLKALGTATAVVGGILILDDAIDALLKTMREAPPATEALTGQLLDLADAKVSDLGKSFDDLGNSLDFFSKNEPSSAWVDWIPNITGLLPGENAQEKMDRLRESFEALDSALANIATTGSADKAREAFASLAAAENLTGDQQKALLDVLPRYKEALAGAANQAKLAGDGAKKGADGVTALGDASDGATDKVQGFKAALEELNGLLDKRDALRNYQAAIADFKNEFKAKDGFDIRFEGGRQNQAVARRHRSSAGALASHLKGSGVAPSSSATRSAASQSGRQHAPAEGSGRRTDPRDCARSTARRPTRP
jgi:hypothetical protein